MEKQFYPSEEDYEELEKTIKVFDWKDESIKFLKFTIYLTLFGGLFFGFWIGLH